MTRCGTVTMRNAYRLCFFEDRTRQPVAVLVLHFSSEQEAIEEAALLLAASALSHTELWQGTRLLWRSSRSCMQVRWPGAYATAV